MAASEIIIRGAAEHNLKRIDLTLPRNKLVVITGVSGSGKSSLAFDTLYAEGQRRYVESLSAYARQFLEQMEKPDVESIEGLSPAISIEQKHDVAQPRSTVGTVTEIYDYLRLLFARVGTGPTATSAASRSPRSRSSRSSTRCWSCRGQPSPGPGPDRAGKQGIYKKELARGRPQGLRAGPGRRRGSRSGRRDRPRQAQEAHHRDRGRSSGDQAGPQEPVDRLGRDRARGGRGHWWWSTSPASATCCSLGTWPARAAGSRCPSWRRGCSRSTRRTARVPGVRRAGRPQGLRTRSLILLDESVSLRDGALAWGDGNWHQVLESACSRPTRSTRPPPTASSRRASRRCCGTEPAAGNSTFQWKGKRSTYEWRKVVGGHPPGSGAPLPRDDLRIASGRRWKS